MDRVTQMDRAHELADDIYSAQDVTLADYGNDVASYVSALMELARENHWLGDVDASDLETALTYIVEGEAE